MKSLATLLLATGVAVVSAQSTVTLSDPTATATVGNYVVGNNLWGISHAKDGHGVTTFDTANQPKDGVAFATEWEWTNKEDSDAGVPKGYPNAGILIDPSARKLVRDIASLSTSSKWQYASTDVHADVIYDLFTGADQNHGFGSGDYELIVMTGNYGDIHGVGTINPTQPPEINGQAWQFWSGNLTGQNQMVLTFMTPPGPQREQRTDWSGDIKPFFDWVTKEGFFPADKQYLISLQFGTETFYGGSTFTASDFTASIA